MTTKALLDGALTGVDFEFDIRIDKESQKASVIDVIRKINNCSSAHAGEILSRLGSDFKHRCAYIRINKRGKETPVADAVTLVEIVWMLPGKIAKEFRLQSAQYICRVLGADQSLAKEIEMRQNVTPQAAKDFFLHQPAGAMVVRPRDSITIGGVQVEIPKDDDSPVIKKLLQDRLDKALAEEAEENKSARDQRLMVSRESHKRTLAELAIENGELAKKRTRVVHELLHTLKTCELIHPSLMAAAIGSISNMAADAAGINLTSRDMAPTHLEEFSAMASRLCRTTLDLTQLSAIGRLAAAEYRKRYDGKNPERVEKQVNGAIRPVNVYSESDREWVETLVTTYVTNLPVQRAKRARLTK
jgi:hypothetical protein